MFGNGHSDNYHQNHGLFSDYGYRDFTQIIPEKNRWRFYRIEVQQGLFATHLIRAWGRIGSNVRLMEEFYSSIDEAIKEANRLYKRKLKKGYKEVESIFAQEFRTAK